jgi:hypothetical protein
MTRLESWWSAVQEMCQHYDLDPPFEPEDFCAVYNKAERYPIILQPQPMSEGRHVSGACHFESGVFYAFYSTAGSRLLQVRTKWHEIGHVLLGHVGPENPDVLLTHGAFMTTVQENEAEDFAAVMTVYARLGGGNPLSPFLRPGRALSAGPASFELVVHGLLRRE